MAGDNIDLNTLYQANAYWFHTNPTLGMNIDWSCSRANPSTSETIWNFNVNVYDRPEYRNFGYVLTTSIYVNNQFLGDGIVLYGNSYGDTNPPEPFSLTGKSVDIRSSTAEIKIYSTCTAYCNHSQDGEAYWVNGERTDIRNVTIDDYNPHKTPSIDVKLPDNVSAWTKYGSTSIRCTWNRNDDPHSHNIYLSSNNREIYNADSGDGSGDFTQTYDTPDRDTSYKVYGKITDSNDGGYYAEDWQDRGVWGIPSINVSLANSSKIIVNTPNRITVRVGKLNADTGSSEKVWITVNGETVKTWEGLSTGTEYNNLTYDYTPTVDGQTYIVKAYVKHGYSDEMNDAETSFKTYVTPVVGDISGTTPFSPQDDITYNWTNNSSDIADKGESPVQKVSILNSSVTNVTHSATSLALAPSGTYWVQNIFNDIRRSVDQLNSTLTVTLTNNDSGVSASKSKSFVVQYTPTKNLSVTSVENQGRTIAIDNDAYTTIKWTYPWNSGVAGVVSGFRVRIYSDSNYSTLVATREVTTTYENFITGPTYSIDIDNEIDMARGVMNYADITPFYKYPIGETKSYGPVVQVGQLIKPYKFMAKPVIAYPINNTTWHNKQFRVLLPLAEDRDFDTYSSTVQNTYKYSDMEIKVNNTVYAFSGTYTGSTAYVDIFSSDINKVNMSNHKKLMGINPSLVSSFPDVSDGSTFRISVRVQRGNYYFTDQEMQGQDSLGTIVKTWSDWSDEIILNKSSIAPQDLAVGMEIKASHYQTVHNWGLRLLACYPINSKDDGDVDQVRGNQIDGSQTQTASGSDEYEAVFRTMQNLMTGVNNYCTYDRAPVKFNSNPTFSALEEIITSAESGTDRYGSTGRNYMNLLTRYMNEYLK